MDKSDVNQDPPLCVKGCGFYGNPLNNNLCSKCAQLAGLISTTPCTSHIAQDNQDNQNVTVSPTIEPVKEPTPPKKINRCDKCNKKVGLLGIKCRCEKLFCAAHLHAEEHDCDFDYKQHSKDHLAINNPTVVKSKITRF